MTGAPNLNISILETYNSAEIAVLDTSSYPSTSYQVQNPYIEITPPGFFKQIQVFTPRSINIYNAVTLNMAADSTGLPDGLYKIRYSINPNYENFIEKSYYKIDQLRASFDKAFLSMGDILCNSNSSEKTRLWLNEVEFYIQAAVAAANSCNDKLAQEFYEKAKKFLDKIHCYVHNM